VGGAVFYRKRKSVAVAPPAVIAQPEDVKASDVDQTVPAADSSLESLEKQLDECLPESCPRAVAVQFALDQLLARGAASLDHSSEGAGGGVYSQAAKRIMQTLSSLIQKKVEEAGSLLLAAQSIAPPEDATLTPPPGMAKGQLAAERYFTEIPPIIRELSRGSQMLPLLQQRLKSLEDEEASWLELRAKCQAPPSAPLTQAPVAMGEGSMDVDPPAHASLLKETEEVVNSSLALQVESLSSFLAKVGALVAKGEAACAMLQADYHQEKFKTFPHMNSPAWLIRQIVNRSERSGGEI
jgi:hypothetical protein